ncbi:hypothetical protein SDC9_178396 [bioreactor metagenome]|uniref:Uncharacterized protein n=1 Tax=bioreactor metagenome TaxID=1076179 RepID=A0A645GVV0_9ZZZZ
MQAKHDQHLPQPTNQCTGDHRADIVRHNKNSADDIADPGGNRADGNQCKRYGYQQSAGGHKKHFDDTGNEFFKELFNLRAHKHRKNGGDDGRSVRHHDDRDAEKSSSYVTLKHGACQHGEQCIRRF